MVFKKTILDSGIKVLTERIPGSRSVAFGFWVGIGARDESPKLSGISHFLEHLLFKGTKTRTAKEISATFDALGGELNAYTAKEYTSFFGRLLDEHFETGLEVLSDLLQNPLFKSKDISAERQVALEEINLYEDSPDERIHDLLAGALLNGHPLGKVILGKKETVKSLSREEIKNFFSQGYTPPNLVVAAAGSLKHEKVVELVKKYFRSGSLKKPKRKIEKPTFRARLKMDKRKTEQAHLCLGFPGLPAGHRDRFALAILDKILGGGMSSRLFQEIREERGLAYSIYSYHSFYTETGLFGVYVGTKPSQAKKVAALIREEILKLRDKGVTPEELSRAKSHLKGEIVLELELNSQRMARLGRSEITHGEILSVNELIKRIEAAGWEDTKRVAQDLFVPQKMALAAIGPLSLKSLASVIEY